MCKKLGIHASVKNEGETLACESCRQTFEQKKVEPVQQGEKKVLGRVVPKAVMVQT